jgi:hypothetical protein
MGCGTERPVRVRERRRGVMTTITKMTIRVPEDWHIALKQAALDRRTTATQIVLDAVNKYLEEDDTPMTHINIIAVTNTSAEQINSLSVKGALTLDQAITLVAAKGYYPVLNRDGGCCEVGEDAIAVTVLPPGDIRMVSVEGTMVPVTHDTCTSVVEVWLPDGKISLRVAHDEDPDVTLDGSAACHYLRYEDGEASEYTIYYPEIAEHKDDEYGDWEHYYSIEGWYVRHSSWDPQ